MRFTTRALLAWCLLGAVGLSLERLVRADEGGSAQSSAIHPNGEDSHAGPRSGASDAGAVESEVDRMIRQPLATSAAAAEDESWQDRPVATSRVLDLLKWPFVACLVLTGIHCYLGIHVISRGVIFVDLALAQMAALGGVVALLFDLDPGSWKSYGMSLVATLLGATFFSLGRLKKQSVPQEAIIGIIFAVSSALALLLLSKAPSEQAERTQTMFGGRILTVQPNDILKMTILYVAIGVFHWVYRRRFMAISFQHQKPQQITANLRWWDFLFYASFGVVVTSSVQVAGILLVFSFLIVPAVCASLLAERIGFRLLIGWTIGVVASVLGLYLSVHFDLPPGESVVVTFGGLLVLVAIVRSLRLAPVA